MKLLRNYCKAGNFNSIGFVKKRDNSDRNSNFFNLCSASLYNDFLHFRYGTSIHFKPILLKTVFFLDGTLGRNGSNTFQRKITTTKHRCFFYENRQEQLMWQKIAMSSCNKTFKQVLSFLSNLTSVLFILRIALSSHLSEIRSKFLN